jgi:hypothetical protein
LDGEDHRQWALAAGADEFVSKIAAGSELLPAIPRSIAAGGLPLRSLQLDGSEPRPLATTPICRAWLSRTGPLVAVHGVVNCFTVLFVLSSVPLASIEPTV